MSGGVNRGGSNTPDEADEDEAESLQEQSRGRLGSSDCSDEYFRDMVAAMEATQAGGDTQRETQAAGVIQECLEEKLKRMEQLCQTDRMKLRRKEFLALLQLFQSFPNNEENIQKLKELMFRCTAKYETHPFGAYPVAQGTTVSYRVDASVCGYVDDEWQGEVEEEISYPPGHWRCQGPIKFSLPAYGGAFPTYVQVSCLITGPYTHFPWSWSGQHVPGHFDNQAKVTIHYILFDVWGDVSKTSDECEGDAYQDFAF